MNEAVEFLSFLLFVSRIDSYFFLFDICNYHNYFIEIRFDDIICNLFNRQE